MYVRVTLIEAQRLNHENKALYSSQIDIFWRNVFETDSVIETTYDQLSIVKLRNK